MVMFGERWAHAHDVQQDAFMRLAAMFAAANPRYRDLPWFRDWWREWLAVVGAQGNGLSDVLVRDYLTDGRRIEVFGEFLREYRAWLEEVGSVVEEEFRIEPGKAAAFAHLLEAVVLGDDENPAVHRRTDG